MDGVVGGGVVGGWSSGWMEWWVDGVVGGGVVGGWVRIRPWFCPKLYALCACWPCGSNMKWVWSFINGTCFSSVCHNWCH